MAGKARRLLPAGHPSLALGLASPPGTLGVLGLAGGVLVPPADPEPVSFGRDSAEVTVPLGEDDRRVSRHHGVLHQHGGRWWVRATGKVPLRLPRSRLLFPGAGPVAVAPGYLPVFVRGSGGREHILEIRVADGVPAVPAQLLTDRERLALVVLGQGFLRCEEHPRLVPPVLAAARLAVLDPGGGWGTEEVAAVVSAVRARVHPGVPVERLVPALVAAGVLVSPDLALLAPISVRQPEVAEWMPPTRGG
ncbi:hypothetical protein ATK36_0633 [Amycolatopsis sulphurea]|uniref:FHA domain-containing protein n=1 Tax=Amycolatopsis sulphurea TaxID=76022 RepID=A0A2A9G0X5_9PSEU|nr:FHA domain-containing protein [Amycolatopsis sulphurea]PFG57078.1 hypothetical protein ATK36_0633 [Amycolatopsis sulphurea]